MRDNFSNGPRRHMRGDFFPIGPGPPHDRWFFKWASLAKREVSFLTVGSGYKIIIIMLRVSPGWQNKHKVLKLADKSWIMNLYLVDNKCKCVNEMCLSVSIKGIKQKLLIYFIIECSTQSSSSLLFSYFGLTHTFYNRLWIFIIRSKVVLNVYVQFCILYSVFL